MSPPFFFPVLLMVSGGFTTLYSMSARCSAFLFFRFKKQLVCVCRQGQLYVGFRYVAAKQMSHLANLVPNSAVRIFMSITATIAYPPNFISVFFVLCFFYAIFASPSVLPSPCACRVVLTWGGVRGRQLDSY